MTHVESCILIPTEVACNSTSGKIATIRVKESLSFKGTLRIESKLKIHYNASIYATPHPFLSRLINSCLLITQKYLIWNLLSRKFFQSNFGVSARHYTLPHNQKYPNARVAVVPVCGFYSSCISSVPKMTKIKTTTELWQSCGDKNNILAMTYSILAQDKCFQLSLPRNS